jgi:hypothetical protein
LTLGAQGGVYIGGGIVPRLGGRIATSCFRERFESKGRFRTYLARVPTWVITTPDDAALRGADRALDDRLARGRCARRRTGPALTGRRRGDGVRGSCGFRVTRRDRRAT